MAQIYDSRHTGQEVDKAVDDVQTTIPAQVTQIGSNLDQLDRIKRGNGLYDGNSTATAAAVDLAFGSSVINIELYHGGVQSTMYIRLFGYYTSKMQMTITPDKSTFIDLTDVSNLTYNGVQIYNLVSRDGNTRVRLIFDWDKYHSITGDSSTIALSDQNYIWAVKATEEFIDFNQIELNKDNISAQGQLINGLQGNYEELNRNVIGFYTDTTKTWENKDRAFINSIKGIKLYGVEDGEIYYLRLFGYYSTSSSEKMQFSITHDKSAFIDLTCTDNVEHTGQQTYVLRSSVDSNVYMRFTFDWDVWSASQSNFYYNSTKYICYTKGLGLTEGRVSELESEVDDLSTRVETLEESSSLISDTIGGGYSGTKLMASDNRLVCPVRTVTSLCKVKRLHARVNTAGVLKVYVGSYDQLYLFVVRESHEYNVAEGDNTIDVSEDGIYLQEGETLAARANYRFYADKSSDSTDPLAETSYLYNTSSNVDNFQLQVYGAAYEFRVAFTYEIESSENIKMSARVTELEDKVRTMQETINELQSTQYTVLDNNGNRYKMSVSNGSLLLTPMQFSHVLCIGNSYTVHPTLSDGSKNAWFGHWAMAASSKDTAWTTLLQTALRQKVSSAKVTPIFGRNYETNSALQPTNPSSLIYWDSEDVQHSFIDDIANFSDVDCIVVALGTNYGGDAWYSRYSALITQLMTWYPSAYIVCCSTPYSSDSDINSAITQVAAEKGIAYTSLIGSKDGNKSLLGNFVYGQDGQLHQIGDPTVTSISTATWQAVANHYGDNGQYKLLDIMCSSFGIPNNAVLFKRTISSIAGITAKTSQSTYLAGSVVSVFLTIADGATLTSVNVTDSGGNSVAVADQGNTDYGRIFTFVMPSSDVNITIV